MEYSSKLELGKIRAINYQVITIRRQKSLANNRIILVLICSETSKLNHKVNNFTNREKRSSLSTSQLDNELEISIA